MVPAVRSSHIIESVETLKNVDNGNGVFDTNMTMPIRATPQMRNSPNILHRDSINNPNELSFSTNMEPCSPIQIQHKNAKTAMAGHFKIRKGSLEREGKDSAMTDLPDFMRKPIMGGSVKPPTMMNLKPMIRRKNTIRDCHYTHPKVTKGDWKL